MSSGGVPVWAPRTRLRHVRGFAARGLALPRAEGSADAWAGLRLAVWAANSPAEAAASRPTRWSLAHLSPPTALTSSPEWPAPAWSECVSEAAQRAERATEAVAVVHLSTSGVAGAELGRGDGAPVERPAAEAVSLASLVALSSATAGGPAVALWRVVLDDLVPGDEEEAEGYEEGGDGEEGEEGEEGGAWGEETGSVAGAADEARVASGVAERPVTDAADVARAASDPVEAPVADSGAASSPLPASASGSLPPPPSSALPPERPPSPAPGAQARLLVFARGGLWSVPSRAAAGRHGDGRTDAHLRRWGPEAAGVGPSAGLPASSSRFPRLPTTSEAVRALNSWRRLARSVERARAAARDRGAGPEAGRRLEPLGERGGRTDAEEDPEGWRGTERGRDGVQRRIVFESRSRGNVLEGDAEGRLVAEARLAVPALAGAFSPLVPGPPVPAPTGALAPLAIDRTDADEAFSPRLPSLAPLDPLLPRLSSLEDLPPPLEASLDDLSLARLLPPLSPHRHHRGRGGEARGTTAPTGHVGGRGDGRSEGQERTTTGAGAPDAEGASDEETSPGMRTATSPPSSVCSSGPQRGAAGDEKGERCRAGDARTNATAGSPAGTVDLLPRSLSLDLVALPSRPPSGAPPARLGLPTSPRGGPYGVLSPTSARLAFEAPLRAAGSGAESERESEVEGINRRTRDARGGTDGSPRSGSWSFSSASSSDLLGSSDHLFSTSSLSCPTSSSEEQDGRSASLGAHRRAASESSGPSDSAPDSASDGFCARASSIRASPGGVSPAPPSSLSSPSSSSSEAERTLARPPSLPPPLRCASAASRLRPHEAWPSAPCRPPSLSNASSAAEAGGAGRPRWRGAGGATSGLSAPRRRASTGQRPPKRGELAELAGAGVRSPRTLRRRAAPKPASFSKPPRRAHSPARARLRFPRRFARERSGAGGLDGVWIPVIADLQPYAALGDWGDGEEADGAEAGLVGDGRGEHPVAGEPAEGERATGRRTAEEQAAAPLAPRSGAEEDAMGGEEAPAGTAPASPRGDREANGGVEGAGEAVCGEGKGGEGWTAEENGGKDSGETSASAAVRGSGNGEEAGREAREDGREEAEGQQPQTFHVSSADGGGVEGIGVANGTTDGPANGTAIGSANGTADGPANGTAIGSAGGPVAGPGTSRPVLLPSPPAPPPQPSASSPPPSLPSSPPQRGFAASLLSRLFAPAGAGDSAASVPSTSQAAAPRREPVVAANPFPPLAAPPVPGFHALVSSPPRTLLLGWDGAKGGVWAARVAGATRRGRRPGHAVARAGRGPGAGASASPAGRARSRGASASASPASRARGSGASAFASPVGRARGRGVDASPVRRAPSAAPSLPPSAAGSLAGSHVNSVAGSQAGSYGAAPPSGSPWPAPSHAPGAPWALLPHAPGAPPAASPEGERLAPAPSASSLPAAPPASAPSQGRLRWVRSFGVGLGGLSGAASAAASPRVAPRPSARSGSRSSRAPFGAASEPRGDETRTRQLAQLAYLAALQSRYRLRRAHGRAEEGAAALASSAALPLPVPYASPLEALGALWAVDAFERSTEGDSSTGDGSQRTLAAGSGGTALGAGGEGAAPPLPPSLPPPAHLVQAAPFPPPPPAVLSIRRGAAFVASPAESVSGIDERFTRERDEALGALAALRARRAGAEDDGWSARWGRARRPGGPVAGGTDAEGRRGPGSGASCGCAASPFDLSLLSETRRGTLGALVAAAAASVEGGEAGGGAEDDGLSASLAAWPPRAPAGLSALPSASASSSAASSLPASATAPLTARRPPPLSPLAAPLACGPLRQVSASGLEASARAMARLAVEAARLNARRVRLRARLERAMQERAAGAARAAAEVEESCRERAADVPGGFAPVPGTSPDPATLVASAALPSSADLVAPAALPDAAALFGPAALPAPLSARSLSSPPALASRARQLALLVRDSASARAELSRAAAVLDTDRADRASLLRQSVSRRGLLVSRLGRLVRLGYATVLVPRPPPGGFLEQRLERQWGGGVSGLGRIGMYAVGGAGADEQERKSAGTARGSEDRSRRPAVLGGGGTGPPSPPAPGVKAGAPDASSSSTALVSRELRLAAGGAVPDPALWAPVSPEAARDEGDPDPAAARAAAVALGAVALFVDRAAAYLGVPLAHPPHFEGSTSTVAFRRPPLAVDAISGAVVPAPVFGGGTYWARHGGSSGKTRGRRGARGGASPLPGAIEWWEEDESGSDDDGWSDGEGEECVEGGRPGVAGLEGGEGSRPGAALPNGAEEDRSAAAGSGTRDGGSTSFQPGTRDGGATSFRPGTRDGGADCSRPESSGASSSGRLAAPHALPAPPAAQTWPVPDPVFGGERASSWDLDARTLPSSAPTAPRSALRAFLGRHLPAPPPPLRGPLPASLLGFGGLPPPAGGGAPPPGPRLPLHAEQAKERPGLAAGARLLDESAAQLLAAHGAPGAADGGALGDAFALVLVARSALGSAPEATAPFL